MLTTKTRSHLLLPAALLCLAAAAPAALAADDHAGRGERHDDHGRGKHADDHGDAKPAPTSTAAKEARAPVVRLTVADGAGTVTVRHAASGRSLLRAALPSPASALSVLGDGRHVAATMGVGNAVQLLDTGSWTEPHDDHTHSYVGPARLAGKPLASVKPSHVVGVGDEVIVFGDGSGIADRYSIAAVASGTATASPVKAAFPHHGVGVPFGGSTLVSAAPAAAARPDGVTQLDASGRELARFGGCPGLHGETSGDGWAAFGCADGTLILDGSPLKATKVAYPAAAGALRVGTWLRSRSGRHLVGALGTAGVLIIDRRTASQHLTVLPGTVHAAAVDHATGLAYALTRDGRLHRIRIATGAVTGSAAVIAPFSAPSGAPAPKLAAAGGRVAISEPAASRVLVAAGTSLDRARSIRTDAPPVAIALSGTAPAH